jgi:hypothetical protein
MLANIDIDVRPYGQGTSCMGFSAGKIRAASLSLQPSNYIDKDFSVKRKNA